MRKYIISTLTAAAAMAVPAFSAELIGSWDFSSYTATTSGGLGSVQSSVTYDGEHYLTLVSGSNIAYGGAGTYNGYYLNITSSSSYSDKTTIDISDANVTLDQGICIVLNVTDMGGNSGSIYAAIGTDNHADAAAIGEGGTTSSGGRAGYFYAEGQNANATADETLPGLTLSYPYTIALTFQGDTMSIYELLNGTYTLVAQATMNDGIYEAVAGTIGEVAIGSWDSTSTSGEFTTLGVASIDIYALPEPSMFGLFFGLGAIGLVATRRRKRA